MAETTMEKLAGVSPDLAEGFRVLRAAAVSAGPLSDETVELIAGLGASTTVTSMCEALDVLDAQIARVRDEQ